MGSVLFVLAVAAGVVSVQLHRAEPYVRARIVAELQKHFHARVELDSFHMSLANGLWAEGKGLRIWAPTSRASDESATANADVLPLTPGQIVGGWKGMLLSSMDHTSGRMEREPKFRFASWGRERNPISGSTSTG